MRVRYGTGADLKAAAATEWVTVSETTDFIHQFPLRDLQPGNGPRFWLCKNDFWKLAHDFKTGSSGPRVFGGIDVKFPGLEGGSNTEQHLYDAATVTKWAGDKGGGGVEVRSWVAASENMLVVELSAVGKETDVQVKLWVQEGDNSEVTKAGKAQPSG